MKITKIVFHDRTSQLDSQEWLPNFESWPIVTLPPEIDQAICWQSRILYLNDFFDSIDDLNDLEEEN